MLSLARWFGAALGGVPRAFAAALAAAWYGLIWWSSSRPASPEPSTTLVQVLSNSAHAPLFGLWATWLSLLAPRVAGWPELRRSARVVILAVAALGGLVDEAHQHLWSSGRDFSLLDVVTDLCGAWLALRLVALAGAPSSSAARWNAQLALTALGSLLAGALATFAPRCFPGVGWL